MKTKYLFIEFSVIFLVFVLPPLVFVSQPDPFAITRFSIFSLVELMLCALLYFQSRYLEKALPEDEQKKIKNLRYIKTLYWWALTLGCLMLVYAFIEVLANFLKISAESHEPLKINSAHKWIFTILNICVSALYEESLYRKFIPECLIKFSEKKHIPPVLPEILSILIFAFSHRYLGIPAVINAAVCGTILRISCIKTDSIRAGTIAHAVYNFTLVIFSVSIK